MNELQIFNNPKFGQIRMVKIEGKPYAVGIDVARMLEYAKPSQAVIDHCKGIRKLGIPSEGGNQETNVIPEGDIYRLIVKAADQSKNPDIKAKAEEVERWIFDEVIPSIRKTGGYVSNDDLFINTYLPFADENTKALFKTTLAVIKEQNEKIRQLTPKAKSYDILMDASGCLTMDEVAKTLDIKGIGRNNMFKLLTLERIIYKKGDIYLPMQEYKSHFVVKQNPVRRGDMIVERSQLFMTPKGLDWLAHKLIDKGYQVNYYKGKSA